MVRCQGVKPKRDLIRLCVIKDSLEKLNIESVVETVGLGQKEAKGSEKKSPTHVKCARSLGPEVQQPPTLPVAIKILHPSINSLKNIPVKKVEKNQKSIYF